MCVVHNICDLSCVAKTEGNLSVRSVGSSKGSDCLLQHKLVVPQHNAKAPAGMLGGNQEMGTQVADVHGRLEGCLQFWEQELRKVGTMDH